MSVALVLLFTNVPHRLLTLILNVQLFYFILHTLGKKLGYLQTFSSSSTSSLPHKQIYESVVQCKSAVHGIKASQFNPPAKFYIPVFSLEKGCYFVGEVLFPRNFPTILMYFIIFCHTDRLVCAHAQNNRLVRQFFKQCNFKAMVKCYICAQTLYERIPPSYQSQK